MSQEELQTGDESGTPPAEPAGEPSGNNAPNPQHSPQQSRITPPEPPKIEVKGGRGVVIGNFARVVINGIDERVFQRFGLDVRLGFSIIALLTIASAVVIIYLLLPKRGNMKEDLGCEFCVAVAGFAERPGSQERGIGVEFGSTLKRRLEENLAELRQDTDVSIDVWGPAEVGSVSGRTSAELDGSAQMLAQEVGADLLVYGMIEANQPTWHITPTFYISPDYFFRDAYEVIGQDRLGSPFPAPGQPKAVRVKLMNDEASPRGRMLASLALGMTYYVTHDFETALSIFEEALLDAQHWGDPAAQKLLYLLLGNSALSIFNSQPDQFELLDEAEHHYNNAKSLDQDYARAYIGLGSVAYLHALRPARESANQAAMDFGLLEASSGYYLKAVDYALEPDLAHVEEKASMWLGQNYFAEAFAKNYPDLTETVFLLSEEKFNQVIQAYNDHPDEVLRSLAAEAHARKGLIYRQTGRKAECIAEYGEALKLSDDPTRIEIYQKVLADQCEY